MIRLASIPAYPTILHFFDEFAFVARFSIEVTGLLLPFLPMNTSAMNTGKPSVITKNIYNKTNKPPPFSAAL